MERNQMFIPQYYTVVSGIGKGLQDFTAFDQALRTAGIGDYNLVKVSSILPAGCRNAETLNLKKGSIVYAAYVKRTFPPKSCATGSVAVGVAIPMEDSENGVIFELNSETDDAEIIVKDMCREAMLNRQRLIKEIISKQEVLNADQEQYVCGVAAVVMW